MTSTEALSRPELPGSVIILGGGFIAAELGHFLGALGAEITVVQKHDVLLARDDREISQRFTEAFAKRHRVILSSLATRVERKGGKVHVDVRSSDGTQQTLVADDILVAIGLTPNSDTLDLEKTGLRADERGLIAVDEHLETSVEGIFALGDAVGRFNLKHAANHESQYVYNNLRSPDAKSAVNYQAMPRAVFSSPQVAAVGETEDQLRESGVDYVVGRWDYYDTGMGKALDDRVGMVKILAERESEQILGCHIIGTDASTLIHEVVLAMTFGLTTRDIAGTIHIHPALSEVVQRAAASMRAPS